MNPVAMTKSLTGKQTINPKTVLGFYATILGILLAATVAVVGVLAANRVMMELIPGLLIFAGALVVLILLGVFIVSLRDPSKLMLTQVTGTEYAHIQTLILGDSSRGDRLEMVPISETGGHLVSQETELTDAPLTEDAAVSGEVIAAEESEK